VALAHSYSPDPSAARRLNTFAYNAAIQVLHSLQLSNTFDSITSNTYNLYIIKIHSYKNKTYVAQASYVWVSTQSATSNNKG